MEKLVIKTWLNKLVRQIVEQKLPGRQVYCNYSSDSSKMHDENRWIQVQTSFPNRSIHYEYIRGRWELHIEPSRDDDGYKYERIANWIRAHTIENEQIVLVDEGTNCLARYNEIIDSDEKLEKGLMYLSGFYDKMLSECAERFKTTEISNPYTNLKKLETIDNEEEVCLKTMKLYELFNLNLTIPDYQRIYCWDNKNIRTIWNNLLEMPENLDYHLGTIIIHNTNCNCDIIDGQQRLVTLTIILRALGYNGNMPLLLQRFKSKEACDNIANAKYVINSIKGWDIERNQSLLKNIIEHLTFSVLILKSSNIDLAYTFFSNQNSRGVRLSDYDILKAHHLRFLITNESQSEHLARKWNAISQEYDFNNEQIIHMTLGVHLFRVRKWMRKHACDIADSDRPVKEEYSASPVIPGIPPFGERFYFYEKIQGGAHFFAYTDYFVEAYRQFVKTPQIIILRKFLLSESHWKYESVIETVLFTYFSKFGKQYFSEALFCVASAVAQHRYENARAIQYKINEYVQNQELVMMIDQASSPTFFLAEALLLHKNSGKDLGGMNIKVRFYYALCKVFKGLQDLTLLSNEEDLRMANFMDKHIESLKSEEYE